MNNKNSNPYAPPQSHVADVPAPAEIYTPFFPVSQTKLIVMGLCTFGLYQIYWFYRNWRLVRDRADPQIMPIARAIFTLIWAYPLFKYVMEYARPGLDKRRFTAGPLATLWIILQVSHRLPDPYWWLTFTSVFCLLPVQARINRINTLAAPDHNPNNRLTPWNWAGVGFGGILLFLAILGTLMPVEEM